MATNSNYVNDYNYDVAIIAACDTRGNGRIAWIDNDAGEALVGKKEHKFVPGKNSEHQAANATLVAAKLADMIENRDLTGKNILLVFPDSVAPRFFEAKRVMNQMADSDFDAVRSAAVEKVCKDWMSAYWKQGLEDMITTVAFAVTEGNISIDAMKKSELHERELVCQEGDYVKDDAIVPGKKITVGSKGVIEETPFYRVSSYVKPGQYTVLDRSYDTKDGKVMRFAVSRWENTAEESIPNGCANLIALNKAVSEALPRVKRLEVKLEA